MAATGDSAYPEAFATLDIFVEGSFCDAAGCCHPIAQIVHGRVYEGGESFLAWHRPTNPMTGGSMSSEAAGTAQRHVRLWRSWAEATE